MTGVGPLPRSEPGQPPPGLGQPSAALLLDYQRRSLLLCSTSPLVVIEKSRRIGLTWALALLAVMGAAKRRGKNTFYIGYNLDMAREFIDTCAMWARSLGHALGGREEELFDGADGKPVQAFRLSFGSGFKVVALPSKPRSLRGMQGQIILDEAAFHDDLDEMLKAALAMLIWGGNVIVVSTHDGVDNRFNQLLDEVRAFERGESHGRKGASLTITFDDALDDGLYERVCLVAGREATAEGKIAWAKEIRDFYGDAGEEELDCKPRAGSGSLIKPEDLAACEHADAGRPELYQGGLVYVGRDVARRVDASIIWAFELVGEVLWLRDRWEQKGASFADQDQAFDAIMASRRVAAAWIDQTGMGEKVVEDAQRRHGSYRVHGVLLTGPNRLDLATSLVQRFERGLIRVPADPIIRADLRAIKKASGGQGQVRLVNDGEIHADRFWAAGLACRAADTPAVVPDSASYGSTGAPPAFLGVDPHDWSDDELSPALNLHGY